MRASWVSIGLVVFLGCDGGRRTARGTGGGGGGGTGTSTPAADAGSVTESDGMIADGQVAADANAGLDAGGGLDFGLWPDATPADSGASPLASPGCGRSPEHALGGVNVTFDAGPDADGMRRFFLTLPQSYDPNRPYRLVIGYPGTNWVGEMIRPYLDLEQFGNNDTIFVYPDPLWRDFPGWGNLGGWVLGPHADPANGQQDLRFTEAMLDFVEQRYCIDRPRIFATGHSWGGDIAMVAACFLGDRIRAAVPVAANRPYWFEPAQGGVVSCTGNAAVWTMFGLGDDHFTWQSFAGEFGNECRDFWLAERGCDGVNQFTDLGLGGQGECVEYSGCSANTRYCLYHPRFRHQIPDYFPQATMQYFSQF